MCALRLRPVGVAFVVGWVWYLSVRAEEEEEDVGRGFPALIPRILSDQTTSVVSQFFSFVAQYI